MSFLELIYLINQFIVILLFRLPKAILAMTMPLTDQPITAAELAYCANASDLQSLLYREITAAVIRLKAQRRGLKWWQRLWLLGARYYRVSSGRVWSRADYFASHEPTWLTYPLPTITAYMDTRGNLSTSRGPIKLHELGLPSLKAILVGVSGLAR